MLLILARSVARTPSDVKLPVFGFAVVARSRLLVVAGKLGLLLLLLSEPLSLVSRNCKILSSK